MASMPQAVAFGVAVYYPPGNKIYVFGGMVDIFTGDNTNITQIYDIASNTWTQGANMPDAGSFMGHANGDKQKHVKCAPKQMRFTI